MENNKILKQAYTARNEGMRRNVQIRPGQNTPSKPIGQPVGIPLSRVRSTAYCANAEVTTGRSASPAFKDMYIPTAVKSAAGNVFGSSSLARGRNYVLPKKIRKHRSNAG